MNDPAGPSQFPTMQVNYTIGKHDLRPTVGATLLIAHRRRACACGPQHKCLDRARNVLQIEGAELLERQIRLIPDVVAYGTGDADTAGRAFRPKSDSNID